MVAIWAREATRGETTAPAVVVAARTATFDAPGASKATAMHTSFGRKYNDGVEWKLHYVTAREMYNIARAAEDGLVGDPNTYRNYEITAPPR